MAGVTRPMSQTRKLETKEALFRARKRILKYLVLGFLKQEGFFHTAETFASEAALTGEYEVCDNIDLDIILQDYCSYYLIRFNKQPQFCRKVEQPPVQRPTTRRARPSRVQEEPQRDTDVDLPSTFTITKMLGDDRPQTAIPAIERKPLTGFLANMPHEKKQLVELLYQDIIRPSGVAWDDIKGLSSAKNLLMESVVYPVRYPEVFTGLLEPWRGVLLHGPPGTGKTMLARAVASESSCTFFNVSCSTIVNKWRGESEKIIKPLLRHEVASKPDNTDRGILRSPTNVIQPIQEMEIDSDIKIVSTSHSTTCDHTQNAELVLFEMASYYAPSIIFVDEVETIASDRSAPGEHEASRRLKAQLLTELDGISEREGVVFLLANSNMPWELDPAMLRRLEKRIYIPLPDLETRTELFETFLKNIEVCPKIDYKEFLATRTDGYSGSEIKLVCKEALMSNVRKLLPDMTRKSSGVSRKARLKPADLFEAIQKTKPVAKNLAQRHIEWQAQMGCS